jgi:OOP family OmpA-OmpF porin
MAGSIVESVMSLLGPNVTGPIASQLGESTETVQRGLQGGAAAILSGVAAKADEPGFIGQLFGMITNPANTSSALSSLIANPGAVVPGTAGSTITDLGSRFLSSVFGARLPAVTDAIGQSAGIASSKAGMLMSMASALVLGGLGQHVRESGSSAADLVGKLKSEASGLARFLPAGLSSLLGGVPSAAVAAAAIPVAVAKAGNRWLWPVLLLAVLLLGLLWFFNRAKAPVGEAVQTVSNAGASAVSALGQFFSTKLPDGVELNIPQFGVENKLITFLNDSSKPVDDSTWFNFDRLLFDTGSATLQPTSQEQLGNIAAILKAYPNVHLKIGGYTDNTGDAATNMSLSTARAKNVMDALVNSGIDASRLTPEGYGDQHPIADNATEEGRAQNRRIAMRVTQK